MKGKQIQYVLSYLLKYTGCPQSYVPILKNYYMITKTV